MSGMRLPRLEDTTQPLRIVSEIFLDCDSSSENVNTVAVQIPLLRPIVGPHGFVSKLAQSDSGHT